ncbi:hypothetical protein LPJ74_003198 [Coemansia sp. RSA 1843]|nr:hypothetical protein LPJ74_003198 [Coemansia sp. RSA 1843]
MPYSLYFLPKMSHASEFLDNIKHKIESTFDKASRRMSHEKGDQQHKESASDQQQKGQQGQHGQDSRVGDPNMGSNAQAESAAQQGGSAARQ